MMKFTIFGAILYGVSSVATYLRYRRIPKRSGQPVMKGAEPYTIKKGRTGVFLIHGFGDSPQTMKGMAEYFSSRGMSVHAPLLPGHGTTPYDMTHVTWNEWLEHLLEEYDGFSKGLDRIYVAGSSTGGNLAIVLASKRDVAGVISMGTPMRFKFHVLVRPVYTLYRHLKLLHKKSYPFGKKDMDVVRWKIQYSHVPLKSVANVLELVKLTKKTLPKLRAPLLVMQSERDHMLPRKNAEILYSLGRSKKKLVFVPDSYHVFIMDRHKDMAFKNIYEFMMENEIRPAHA